MLILFMMQLLLLGFDVTHKHLRYCGTMTFVLPHWNARPQTQHTTPAEKTDTGLSLCYQMMCSVMLEATFLMPWV